MEGVIRESPAFNDPITHIGFLPRNIAFRGRITHINDALLGTSVLTNPTTHIKGAF